MLQLSTKCSAFPERTRFETNYSSCTGKTSENSSSEGAQEKGKTG
jgi:hypothetical protein